MIQTDSWAWPGSVTSPKSAHGPSAWMGCVLILVGLLCAWPARADEDEEQYLRIVDIIQQADSLSAKGKTAAARAKYQEAQTALKTFRRNYRDWNPTIVGYRMKYLESKLVV